ncbi:hypothetical protein [Streptomyces sp. NPDC088348]|uniref:hypothetical protein n=1 Tax=Streptomyces sp. NPDC088348 TaxID=3365853 RepID=UPI0037F54EB2
MDHFHLVRLQRLATTVETWWPEILAFLHTGITSAGSEGTNRAHFVEPAPVIVLAGGAEPSVPPVSAWL